MDAWTEVYLYAAARGDHVRREILPRLEAGERLHRTLLHLDIGAPLRRRALIPEVVAGALYAPHTELTGSQSVPG